MRTLRSGFYAPRRRRASPRWSRLPQEAPGEVGLEGRPLALPENDRDVELLQVLLQRLAAERDVARGEELPHVGLQLGRRQRRDPFAHPPDPALGGVLALQRGL